VGAKYNLKEEDLLKRAYTAKKWVPPQAFLSTFIHFHFGRVMFGEGFFSFV